MEADKPLGRPRERGATEPLQVYLTPDAKKKLRKMAEKRKTSMARIVEDLIKEANG